MALRVLGGMVPPQLLREAGVNGMTGNGWSFLGFRFIFVPVGFGTGWRGVQRAVHVLDNILVEGMCTTLGICLNCLVDHCPFEAVDTLRR